MANDNELIIRISGKADDFKETIKQVKGSNEDLKKAIKKINDEISREARTSANEIKKAEQEKSRAARQAAKETENEVKRAAKEKEKAEKEAAKQSEKAVKESEKEKVKATKQTEEEIKKSNEALKESISTVATATAIAFAAVSASALASLNAYASYETALIGVGKTSDISGESLDKLGGKFQQLSQTIPMATNQLLAIAQAGGQLGVRGEENLLKFTDTVAKLGVATDLSGEEAATALTRILTVTQEGVGQIDKFGSVIVALGNNFAATESEITRVATEVSRSTAIFNVSAAESAALAAAMRSLGVRAELGGSAVGRAFRAIQESINNGGASLNNLSKLTKIASTDLKQAFEKDAVGVFQKFLEGIGEASRAGGDSTKILDSFKLKGEEILKVLPVMALNSELVAKALDMANNEMENATALNEEASRAFSTVSSQMQLTKNAVTQLATGIGQELAPDARQLFQGLTNLISGFNQADSSTVKIIASLLKFSAAILGSLAAVSSAAVGYIAIRKAIDGITIAANVGRIAVAKFTAAITLGLSTILIFLPEIIDGLGRMFGTFKENEGTSAKSLDQITSRLKGLRDEQAKLSKDSSEYSQIRQGEIQKEIDRLEELRQQRIRTSGDFGTGKLLMPEMNAPQDLTASFAWEQQVPMRADTPEDKRAEIEAAFTQTQNEEIEKRIRQAQYEAATLKAINKLRADEVASEEIALVQKRLAINQQRNEALLITDENLKAAQLEVINQKFAEQDILEAQYAEKQLERNLKLNEQMLLLDEYARQAQVELRDVWDEEDLIKLAEQLQTQEDMNKAALERELKQKQTSQNTFLDNQRRYGTAYAKFQDFLNKDQVKGFLETTQQLEQLAQSRNATMKAIGKAAARVNAAIATAEGAIKAYSSLAGIPIVGPALGAAAAAAIVAFGVEKQAQISAMASGGVVGGIQSVTAGSRDRVPILAEEGEIIVPKAIAPNYIQSQGIPDTQSNPTLNGMGGGTTQIEIEMQSRVSEYITLNQRAGRALGIITR